MRPHHKHTHAPERECVRVRVRCVTRWMIASLSKHHSHTHTHIGSLHSCIRLSKVEHSNTNVDCGFWCKQWSNSNANEATMRERIIGSSSSLCGNITLSHTHTLRYDNEMRMMMVKHLHVDSNVVGGARVECSCIGVGWLVCWWYECNKSPEQRLNLSRSWHRGHSHTYNTSFFI